MITIAQEHYDKMLNLIRLLSSNISLLHPEATQLRQVLQQCQQINSKLNEVYEKLSSDLESILATNQQLNIENGELNGKIVAIKAEMGTLVQTNTMQRSDLAKYLNEINKWKDSSKNLKEAAREKLKEKDITIQQLSQKVKKYKRISQEQRKKVEQLDKKLCEIEISQKSSAKQAELDDEMLRLENDLKELNMIEPDDEYNEE